MWHSNFFRELVQLFSAFTRLQFLSLSFNTFLRSLLLLQRSNLVKTSFETYNGGENGLPSCRRHHFEMDTILFDKIETDYFGLDGLFA